MPVVLAFAPLLAMRGFVRQLRPIDFAAFLHEAMLAYLQFHELLPRAPDMQ